MKFRRLGLLVPVIILLAIAMTVALAAQAMDGQPAGALTARDGEPNPSEDGWSRTPDTVRPRPESLGGIPEQAYRTEGEPLLAADNSCTGPECRDPYSGVGETDMVLDAGLREVDISFMVPQEVGGPDDFGYTWDDSVPLSWIDASSGTDTGINSSLDHAGPVDLGFAFPFYENSYSQLYISRYGFVAFNSENIATGFVEIPSAQTPNDLIAPCAMWAYNVNGYVRYLSGGEAPDRWFAVEWNRLQASWGDEYTFQVVLHENGDVTFQYGTMGGGLGEMMSITGGGGSQTSGIEDWTGTDGLLVREPSQLISSSHAVQVVRPVPSARVRVYPVYQGRFVRDREAAVFEVPVRNTGDLGGDTFDLVITSTWSTTVYDEDGATLLVDTDGDGIVDTGNLSAGESATVLVEVTTPAAPSVGDYNAVDVEVRSSLDPSVSRIATLQTAVPAPFAQVYSDNADGAMSLYLAHPGVQRVVKATSWYRGIFPAVAEMPDGFAYVWTSPYRTTGDISIREIEFALLDQQGETTVNVTKLSDHTGATMTTYDYSPAVAATANGEVGVVWQRTLYDGDPTQHNVNLFFSVLSSTGELIAGPVSLTNNDIWGTYDDYDVPEFYDPRVTVTGDNRFVLAWHRGHRQAEGEVENTFFAVYDSDGSLVQAPMQLTSSGPGDAGADGVNLASLPGNQVLLTWFHTAIYHAVVDSGGGVVQVPAPLISSSGGTWYDSTDVVRLEGGHIVVAWVQDFQTRFAILDSDLTLLAGPTALSNPAATSGARYVSVTAAGDLAILTWTDAEYPQHELYYALVDADGNVRTAPMLFYRSDAARPDLLTSRAGYGNTSYGWSPPADVDGRVSVGTPLVTAPPGGYSGFHLEVANGGATVAAEVVLTVTWGVSLTYVADSSGITPTVSAREVVWSLPDLALLEGFEWTVYINVPADTPIGTHCPVTFTLSSAGPEENPLDNVVTGEVEVVDGRVPALRMSQASEPATLDPALAQDLASINVIEQLFIGLVDLDDETGDIIPELATGWAVSAAADAFTFTLRNDVTWSDGNPVTAEDVRYGILRSLDPESGGYYAYVLHDILNASAYSSGEITDPDQVGVTAVDSTTLRIDTERPAAYLPVSLSMWVARPMPRWAIEAHGVPTWTHPANIVTSGPYTLTEWIDDVQIVLDKNPDYYAAEGVQIERVHIWTADGDTAWQMYLDGHLDTATVPASQIESARQDAVLSQEVHRQRQDCTYFYGFVNNKPPMDDVRVRQAFAMATDKQSLVLDVLGDAGQLAAGQLAPPGVWGAPDLGSVGLPYNPAGAADLLQEYLTEKGMGLEDLNAMGITLMYNTSTGHASIATALQDDWEANLGVTVTLEDRAWTDFLNLIRNTTPLADVPHIFRMSWCSDYPDENNWLRPVFHNEDGMNWFRRGCLDDVCSQRVPTALEPLLEQAASEPDPAVRKALYLQAERLLAEDEASYIPLYFYGVLAAAKPYLYRSYPAYGFDIATWRITRVEGVVGTDGGTLVSYDGSTMLEFPAGAFADTVLITHIDFTGTPPEAGSGLTGLGYVFDITAVYSDTGEPAELEPGYVYTITVQYTDDELGLIREDSLALYCWDNELWVMEPSIVDPINNTVTATPDHLSLWTILGEPYRVHLPLILRRF